MAAGDGEVSRHPDRDHLRLAERGPAGVLMRAKRQAGQVMVRVAVSLLPLIGSAALVLLAGSVEWQKNQLQQLADQSALDSALEIGIGCDGGQATTVNTAAGKVLA